MARNDTWSRIFRLKTASYRLTDLRDPQEKLSVRISGSRFVIWLTPPSNLSMKFHQCFHGERELIAPGLVGTGVVLSESWRCIAWLDPTRQPAMRSIPKSSVQSKQSSLRQTQFVCCISMCPHTAVDDTFYQKLHEIQRKAKRDDILILGDMSARVSWLSSNEAHLDRLSLDFRGSENGEQLLVMFDSYVPFARP